MDAVSIGAWLGVVTQGATLLSVVVGLYLTVHNRKAIQKVGVQVNGRMDELMAANKVIDTAAGRAGEVADQVERERLRL